MTLASSFIVTLIIFNIILMLILAYGIYQWKSEGKKRKAAEKAFHHMILKTGALTKEVDELRKTTNALEQKMSAFLLSQNQDA